VFSRIETSGAIAEFNFPIVFHGTNTFQSNVGGCLNLYTVTVIGELNFFGNYGAGFGGAIRLGEVSLVSHLHYNVHTY